jgi:hypothetical protein
MKVDILKIRINGQDNFTVRAKEGDHRIVMNFRCPENARRMANLLKRADFVSIKGVMNE